MVLFWFSTLHFIKIYGRIRETLYQEHAMISINICDDEEYMLDTAYKGITEIMSELGQEFRINRFASGAEMLKSSAKPDMYFLDIQIQPFDGMETARRLRVSGYDGIIVFMTVLGGQVYDSFEVQPFDFLVKPLDTERLRKTLEPPYAGKEKVMPVSELIMDILVSAVQSVLYVFGVSRISGKRMKVFLTVLCAVVLCGFEFAARRIA